MRYLRTNTATIVTVGPFLDKTDGVTLETGLTITNERISLTVDANDGSAPTLVLDNVTGATSGTNNDLNYITNCDAGLMQIELAAANVNYLGRAFLTITDAANHCPVFHEFTILPAQVYDSLIAGTDLLQADTTQIGGTAQTARDLGTSVLLSSGTGTGQLSIASGVVAANATQISGDATAADNAESFFDGTGYAGTNNVIPTVTTLTGHTAQTGDAFARLGAPAGASVSADVAAVKAQTAAIETDTQDLQTQVGTDGAGLTNMPWNAAWDAEVQSEAQDAITASALATAAALDAVDNFLDTEIAAILADTNELQTDWVNGGRLDLILDIIAADTTTDIPALIADVPTVAEFEARTLPSADYTIVSDLGTVQTGDSYARLGAPAGASVSADIAAIEAQTDDIGIAGAGLTALATQTSVNDIPTNAELATALAGADDAVLAALADVPTVAEFEARTLPSADYTIVSDLGTVQTGDSYARLGAPAGASVSADIADVPTVAEMNARTLVAANYFDPATDVVARVTLVDTTTTNTDMRGTNGAELTGAAAAAVATLNDISVADIIAGVSEGSLDLAEILRVMLAALAGKSAGGGTATVTFRDLADSKNRITATVDANGNRTAVSVDGS